MRAYVGVTDGDWYRFLASRQLDEVNFWRPAGGREFRAIAPGEPFFFKTHAPHNRVVGGGFFSRFQALRLSDAWRFFGEANGATNLTQMRTRIAQYRREPIQAGEDPVIGCVFLRDVVFFPPTDDVEAPPQFAPNIVQGKGYDISSESAGGYFEELLARVTDRTQPVDATPACWSEAS